MKKTTILAIETSCDDTSASIISDGIILSNIISSQINHTKLGGVVPEIASREHQKNIIFIVESALINANKTKKDLDAVAFTKVQDCLDHYLWDQALQNLFLTA
tara:strand:+ start:1616 stop:1924 length:309 start_codon:yes stop_codon:yes gene_type:complete